VRKRFRSEEEIQKGSALKISAIDSRATLLQSEQNALAADLQLSDLTSELNDLLGLPSIPSSNWFPLGRSASRSVRATST
jgi:hypothetical protein